MGDFPPDGWSESLGTWLTDMDLNTSTTQIGGNSIEFKNTTNQASLISDYLPVQPGAPYDIEALLRADNVTGKNAFFQVQWFTSGKVSAGSNIILNAPLSAINVWEEIATTLNAPATASLARIVVGRSGTSFTMYCDKASMDRAPYGFKAYRGTTSVSLPDVTSTQITFQNETFDHGSVYDNTTYQFTAPISGVWSLEAGALIRHAVGFNGGGSRALLLVSINGAAGYSIDDRLLYAGNTQQGLRAGDTLNLTRGDTVEIQVYHNDGQTLNANFSVSGTIFKMSKE